MKLPLWTSAQNPLLDAISTQDLPTFRSLLEDQDHQLFSQVAPIVAYLLSRHPVPEDYAQKPSSSDPTLQYLARESARNSNAALFRYLLNQYPSRLSAKNRDVERILVNALVGGVIIWEIILEHDAYWKAHVFSGRRWCVLECVIEFQAYGVS